MTAQAIKAESTPGAGYTEGRIRPDTAFWVFVMGSVAGFVVETVWCLFKYGRLECRSSMILGPFIVIYGIGALLLYLGQRAISRNTVPYMFVFGTVAGTAVEYLGSLMQEALLGSVSWDYSSAPLNIDGRVCLLYSVFWGLLAVLWVVAIQPLFEALIRKIPPRRYKPLTWGLAIFLVLDIAISAAAIAQWGMRLDGNPSVHVFAATLDWLFPNELMGKIYPHMLW